MFNEQWRRHFPMPDYEIDALNKEVGVKIYGNTINEKYTKLLKENNTLTLEDCILLDAVQKDIVFLKSMYLLYWVGGFWKEMYWNIAYRLI